jgi:two-component system, NtrC family, response regulator AtoC
MERAAVLADSHEIDAKAITMCLPKAETASSPADLDLANAIAEVERRTILQALDLTGDNMPAAATKLGIGERTLWTKLKKHGI